MWEAAWGGVAGGWAPARLGRGHSLSAGQSVRPRNVQGGKWTGCGDLVEGGRRGWREKTGVQVWGPGGRVKGVLQRLQSAKPKTI